MQAPYARTDAVAMQVYGQKEKRRVDSWQVAGEPAWQVNVGDRSFFGAEPLGQVGERAAEAVGGKDQALARDHGCRNRGPAVLVSPESGAEHTYSMHDSMENQASVCAALTVVRTAPCPARPPACQQPFRKVTGEPSAGLTDGIMKIPG